MTVWKEIAAQIKNATGEETYLCEHIDSWRWKVLRALETLSQRVANLESRQPQDIERTI
jgi:hypothetical protein